MTTNDRTRQLRRAEMLRIGGAALLIVGVFLPWFRTDGEFASLAGERGSGLHVSGWEALPLVGVILIVCAILPLVVAHWLARGRQLSWVPGELTAVAGSIAVTCLLFWGVLNRPGEPAATIKLDWGWWVALAGAVAMIVASVLRTSVHMPRRPPGV